MRTVLVLACVLVMVAAVPTGAQASLVSLGYGVLRSLDRADVVEHAITGWIDPAREQVRFEDAVAFAFDRPASSFHFLLGVDAVIDGVVDVETGASLQVTPVIQWSSLPFVVYRVRMPRTIEGGTQRTLRFTWHFETDAVKAASPMRSPHFLYLGYPSMWYPHTPAEDFFDAQITLHVPPGLRAFADGVLTDEDMAAGRYVYRTEFPTDKLGVGVGRFHVERLRAVGPSGTDRYVEVWRPTGFRTTADEVARHVRETVRVLEPRLGSLPVTGFRVVEMPLVVPASYPSLSTLVYGGDLQQLGLGHAEAPAILAAHETAHKWLGNVAGIPPVGSAWFAEGLAEYLGHLALAEYMPRAWAQRAFRLRVVEPFIETYGGDERVRALSSIEVFDDDGFVLFNKGVFVFRMLHRRIGDEAFFGAIADFVDEYRLRHGTAAHFEAMLRRHVSPSDQRAVDRFLRDWVRGRDLLDYALHVEEIVPVSDDGGGIHGVNAGEQRGYEVALRVTSEGRLTEPGDVEVGFQLADGSFRVITVALDQRERVVVPSRPVFIQLDPNAWLADVDLSNNVYP